VLKELIEVGETSNLTFEKLGDKTEVSDSYSESMPFIPATHGEQEQETKPEPEPKPKEEEEEGEEEEDDELGLGGFMDGFTFAEPETTNDDTLPIIAIPS
jgi:hypothetical protein